MSIIDTLKKKMHDEISSSTGKTVTDYLVNPCKETFDTAITTLTEIMYHLERDFASRCQCPVPKPCPEIPEVKKERKKKASSTPIPTIPTRADFNAKLKAVRKDLRAAGINFAYRTFPYAPPTGGKYMTAYIDVPARNQKVLDIMAKYFDEKIEVKNPRTASFVYTVKMQVL